MRKIAISNLAWRKEEDEKVYQIMEHNNVTGLEISPFRDSPRPYAVGASKKLKAQLNKYGIQIVAFQSILYRFPELVLFSDDATREKLHQHLIKVIDYASSLGAKALVFGGPRNKIRGKLGYAPAFDIAKIFFGRLGDHLKKKKITFCVEPTPAAYGADFIRNTDEAVSLIEAVNSSNIKLNLDVGALITNEENIKDTIIKNARHIGHFHISEPSLKTINTDRFFHENIAEAIGKSSYGGLISVEMLPSKNRNIQSIRDTLAFITQIYKLTDQ